MTGLSGVMAFILAATGAIVALIIFGQDLSFTPMGSSVEDPISPGRLIAGWLVLVLVSMASGIVPAKLLGAHWLIGMLSIPVSFAVSYFVILAATASTLYDRSSQRIGMLVVVWSTVYVLIVLLVGGRFNPGQVAVLIAVTVLFLAGISLPFVGLGIALTAGMVAWAVVPATASLLQCDWNS